MGDAFVAVVDGNAFFCCFMHGAGADLEFDGFVLDAFDDGMDGLVAVGFWGGDVIFECAGDGHPESVEDAQDIIAVFDGFGDDADADKVVHAFKCVIAVFDFMIDAVDVFDAAGDVCLN